MSRTERGSASLAAVACVAVLLLLGAGLGVVGALVRAHRVAQSAADLAALGAAAELARTGDGCGAGAEVAVANHARLVGCEVVGATVTVLVEVEGPHWLGQEADLVARARAGPA